MGRFTPAFLLLVPLFFSEFSGTCRGKGSHHGRAYRREEGKHHSLDRFYYFNAEGKMAEGWFNEDSHWFFAQYDNKEQNSDTAGVVLTGWASIPDEKGKNQIFYFEKDEQGRPRGMVQAEGETNISYLIEGKNYYFDALGYADKKLISFDVTKYPRSRV